MTNIHIPIEHLSARYADDAIDVVAEAFHGNPIARLAMSGVKDHARVPKLRRFYRSVVLAAQEYGKVFIIREAGRVAAVSIAYPPGGYPLPLRGDILNLTGRMMIGPVYTAKYMLYDGYFRRIHFKSPHWYLYFMGVAPGFQGRGLGAALINHLNRLADSDHSPCYLETDKEEVVQFYERHGYIIKHQGEVPGLKNLPVWTMLREQS